MVEAKKGKWDSSDEEGSEDEKAIVAKKRKLEAADKIIEAASTAVSAAISSVSIVVSTVLSRTAVDGVQEGDRTVDSEADKAYNSDAMQLEEEVEEGDVSAAQSPKPPPLVPSSDDLTLAVTDNNSTAIDKAVVAEHNPLHHGCRSVDEYIRLNFIDQGTYGVVFRARCKKTNRIYALKQVKIGKEAAKVGFPVTALRETNILLALKHPNIVR